MCFIQYGKLLYNTKDTLPFMTTLSFIYNFRCLIFYYWYICTVAIYGNKFINYVISQNNNTAKFWLGSINGNLLQRISQVSLIIIKVHYFKLSVCTKFCLTFL